MIENRFSVLCFILVVLLTDSNALKIKPRIANGNPSERNQFKYYVFLASRSWDGSVQLCGGTLISDQWIITAAHCVDHAHKVGGLLGSWRLHNGTEEGRQKFDVSQKSIFIFERFSYRIPLNDIALIKLPKPVTLNEYVQPVYFPCDYEEPTNVTAIGNGGIEGAAETDDRVSPILQWTTLKSVSIDKCRDSFPYISRRTAICAMGENRSGVSLGDSGGPLVSTKTNKLLGITSFSHQDNGHPQVFTKVQAFRKWITQITKIKFPLC